MVKRAIPEAYFASVGSESDWPSAVRRCQVSRCGRLATGAAPLGWPGTTDRLVTTVVTGGMSAQAASDVRVAAMAHAPMVENFFMASLLSTQHERETLSERSRARGGPKWTQ